MGKLSLSHVYFNKVAPVILGEQVKIGITVCMDLDLENHLVHSYTKDRFVSCFSKKYRDEQSVWYDSSVDLHTYTHRDGRVLEDFVQADVGDSIPYVFMALRDAVSKEEIAETLWTSEEMLELQQLPTHVG